MLCYDGFTLVGWLGSAKELVLIYELNVRLIQPLESGKACDIGIRNAGCSYVTVLGLPVGLVQISV